MDEIELVRSLGAVPPSTPAERSLVRALFTKQLQQKTMKLFSWTRPRGRLIGRPVALAIAALLLIGAASAVGAAIFIEWGPVDHPASEAEIRAEIADIEAAIPLPSGQVYPDLFPQWALPNNLAKYLGVQQVQFYAMCAWSNSWLDAYAENDPAKMAAATTVISEFPTWQSLADPRLADDSIRHQIAEVVGGAQAGNAVPVERLVQAACPPG